MDKSKTKDIIMKQKKEQPSKRKEKKRKEKLTSIATDKGIATTHFRHTKPNGVRTS